MDITEEDLKLDQVGPGRMLGRINICGTMFHVDCIEVTEKMAAVDPLCDDIVEYVLQEEGTPNAQTVTFDEYPGSWLLNITPYGR